MSFARKSFSFAANLIDRWQPSESVVLGGAALLTGLGAGAGIWIFKRMVDFAQRLFFTDLTGLLAPLGSWVTLLLPVLGGLIVGLILVGFVGRERHHGVAGIMEAVALAGGRLRYRRIPAKSVAAAISIGSGASVGPEDPSVQIGANIGSMFGQILHLSDERMRTLVAAGAAAGVASAFNAPIAGVFFALEIVLGEITGASVGGVVMAAVVASVFTQAISGPQPAFRVPAYPTQSYILLPFYLVLGLLAGPISAIYIRALYRVRDFFHDLSLPRWLQPALAGVAVGVVGLFLPQVFGVGYETIEKLLAGENLAIYLLLALLVAKLLITAISIGGGFAGGVFAPSLFLGAVLGGGFGLAMQQLFPTLGIAPPAFAMVGMGAVLAGAVHAPLTAILLMFEMTNDYRIILPLMFAVTISLLVSQRMHKESVYTLSLERKGIHLERGKDVEVLQGIRVSEVMQSNPATLLETRTLDEAAVFFQRTHHHGAPVVNADGELVGILTLTDLDRIQAQDGEMNKVTVGQACTQNPLVIYPDESIGTALRRMGPRNIGRLPVVDHQNPHKLLGVLSRSDLVRAYDLALTRQAAMRHRVQQVRLGAIRGNDPEISEWVVHPESWLVGRRVSQVAWPKNCLIASLRRSRQLLIPRGDTILQAGDVIVTVADRAARGQIEEWCLPAEPALEDQDGKEHTEGNSSG